MECGSKGNRYVSASLSCVSLHKNVSEYHAAIDGASQKLTEKSERLSLVDRDLVRRADEHAEELEREADQLEE